MNHAISAGGARLRHPATSLLLVAMLASGALLVILGSRLSFLLDDWGYILYRRDFDVDAFLQPANEHLVAGPVAVWKLLIGVFGIGSTLPYHVVSTAMFLLGAWFLFVWIRRRLGEWPALLATVPVLFLGAAFDDVFWIASITFLGSMACGLGMLLALDRRDRFGDGLACVWLVGSMLFSSLWLSFALGAAVDVVLRRDERDWRRRAYVVAAPVVLYVIWWLGWGHEAESAFSLHNLATTPLYVLDSLAAAIAALLGLATPVEGITSPAGLEWGRPLALLLIGLAAWRIYRLERVPRSLWVVLAIALSFWVLGGLAVKSGRVPWASRYQYPGSALVLLVAADLLRGVKLERRLFAPALIVVAAAVASNGLFLYLSYKSYLRTSRIERADLAALEIARDTAPPGLVLEEGIADTVYVPVEAGPYLSARDAYGSPAYSAAELPGAPPEARAPADKVLAAALEIGLAPASAHPGAIGGCAVLKLPATESLPSGGVTMRPRSGTAEASLGRFSDSFPVGLGALASDRWSELAIPADRSRRPWRLSLSGSGSVELCGRGA
jgi:hypothetical protein